MVYRAPHPAAPTRASKRERPPDPHRAERIEAICVLHDGELGVLLERCLHEARGAGFGAVGYGGYDFMHGLGDGEGAGEGEEDVKRGGDGGGAGRGFMRCGGFLKGWGDGSARFGWWE